MLPDPCAAPSSVLSRLHLSVATNHARLTRVLIASENTVEPTSRARSEVSRSPAATPGAAAPSTARELKALCDYFGINVELDAAGGHGVLREARRVCEFVRTAPTAVGSISKTAGRVQLRRWHWLTAVTLVPRVPEWQQAQQTMLAKLDLSSAPMVASIGTAISMTHVARESCVVAAAAVAAVEEGGDELSEAAHAAAHLLQAARANELYGQLYHALNFFRSVQRTLALRATEYIPRPHRCHSALDPELQMSGAPSKLRSSSARSMAAATAPSAAGRPAAVASSALDKAGAHAPDSAAEANESLLTVATCPVLPPLRPQPVPAVSVSRRLMVEGGHEWYSQAPAADEVGHAHPQPVPERRNGANASCVRDPTQSTFVRDGCGDHVQHQTASADLSALMVEVGRICAHYGNDAAMAAVYGTARYDSAAAITSSKLQGADAEAEISRRLAVASALPRVIRLVTQCLGCEVHFQRAKATSVLSLLEAYDACDTPNVALDLAQQITDLIAARPRLNLEAATFEEAYQASTVAVELESTFVSRLLASHVDETLEAKALGTVASAVSGRAGSPASVGAILRQVGSTQERRQAAGGCALVAVAAHRQVDRLQQLTLARAYGSGPLSNSVPTATTVSRLRCVLLSQGLALSESFWSLPLLQPRCEEKVDVGMALAAAARKAQSFQLDYLPWVPSVAIAAHAQDRAYDGRGRAQSPAPGQVSTVHSDPASDPSSQLLSSELRTHPCLLPGLRAWAEVSRVSSELVELRETLRRARPKMAWVPFVSLLPLMATSSTSSTQPGAPAPRSVVPGREQMQQAEAALSAAKRMVATIAQAGAAAAHSSTSASSIEAILTLLKAERHALLLMLCKERPPPAHPALPLPAKEDASEAALVALVRAASSALPSEADAASTSLVEALQLAPPHYLRPSEADDGAAYEVLLHHAQQRLSTALSVEAAYEEELRVEAAAATLQGAMGASHAESGRRAALSAQQAALSAAELAAREAAEREVASLCEDMRAEIAEIEQRLQQVSSVDLSEAKKAALRALPNAQTWDLAEKGVMDTAEAHGIDPGDPWGSPEAHGIDPLGTRKASLTKRAAREAAAAEKSDAARNRRELLAAERDARLNELRTYIAMRKLREATQESAHARRLDALNTEAVRAIGDAVEKPRAAPAPSFGLGLDILDDELFDEEAPAGGLRSVAEVRETEARLGAQLAAAQRANAAMLDKLAAVKGSIGATEMQHTHHLHSKVRHLCSNTTGLA